MRWFKHYSNAMDSNKLTELLALTGVAGMGRYWLLMELMAKKYDGQKDQEFVFRTKDLQQELSTYHFNSLRKYLQCIHNVGVMSIICDVNVTRISTPILLELQAKDFKKKRSSCDSAAPKSKDKREKIYTNSTANYNAPFQEDGFYEKVHSVWNQNCGSLPKVKTMDSKRKRLVRLAKGDVPGIDDWAKAVRYLASSKFHNGEDGKSFTANLNFLLQDGKLIEILEKSEVVSYDGGHDRAVAELREMIGADNGQN